MRQKKEPNGVRRLSLTALAFLIAQACLASFPVFAAKQIDWDKKLKSGYYQLSIGNTDKAVRTFQGKVKSYPNSGACHTALGVALKKKGKLTDAKAELRKATEIEPSYAEGFYELGAMLEADKDYASAALAFEKYLLLKPASDRRAAVADRVRFCKEHL